MKSLYIELVGSLELPNQLDPAGGSLTPRPRWDEDVVDPRALGAPVARAGRSRASLASEQCAIARSTIDTSLLSLRRQH